MHALLIATTEAAIFGELEAALAARGHATERAHGAAEALSRFAARPSELVVLYLGAGLDGPALVAELRALPGGAQAVVLAVAGEQQVLAHAVHAGADDFMLPPLAPALVGARMAILERAVADRRALAAPGRAGAAGTDALVEGLLRLSPVPTSLARFPQRTMVEVNDAYLRLLGYRREEVVGRDGQELMRYRTPEEGMQLGIELVEGRPVSGREIRLQGADGGEIRVLVSLALVPFRGAPHTLAMFHDITARSAEQEALRRASEGFRSLIEQLPDLVGVVGNDLRLRYLNALAVRTLGYASADELLGRSALELVPEAERTEAAQQLGTLAAEPGTWVQRNAVRKDGTTLPLEWAGLHVTFDGEPMLLMVARDVSRRKRLEAQLLLSERMASVGTLAAGVAHEINNPLAYVSGNLTFALEELEKLELHPPAPDALAATLRETCGALAEARQGAERVRAIVTDLKTFSRDTGEAPGPVDVHAVLESTLSLAASALKGRARLERALAPGLPRAWGSASRLGQVLLNLLVNAAQALPEGAPDRHVVRVSTRPLGAERLEVAVQDTGAGIAPDVLPRIFDPFFTTKPVGVGTGLGLAICHNLVSQMGGRIEVESAPGQGATFRVVLPAEPPRAAAPAPRPAADAAPARARVLVVDDEAYIGSVVTRVLRGHDVVALTDGREALARLGAGERFDLVLCDLMMPHLSGMQLHAALAERSPELLPRLVFLSGGAFTAEAQQFLAAVPNRRVDKPFEPQTLRELVAQALRERT